MIINMDELILTNDNSKEPTRIWNVDINKLNKVERKKFMESLIKKFEKRLKGDIDD